MSATLHQIISYLGHTAFNMLGMILLVITLCVVSSFLLAIVTLGMVGTGAFALASRWHRRRGRRGGARERLRLSFVNLRAKRIRQHNASEE